MVSRCWSASNADARCSRPRLANFKQHGPGRHFVARLEGLPDRRLYTRPCWSGANGRTSPSSRRPRWLVLLSELALFNVAGTRIHCRRTNASEFEVNARAPEGPPASIRPSAHQPGGELRFLTSFPRGGLHAGNHRGDPAKTRNLGTILTAPEADRGAASPTISVVMTSSARGPAPLLGPKPPDVGAGMWPSSAGGGLAERRGSSSDSTVPSLIRSRVLGKQLVDR